MTKPNPSHTHKKMSTYIPSKIESTWEKTDPNTETFIKFMFSKKATKIEISNYASKVSTTLLKQPQILICPA